MSFLTSCRSRLANRRPRHKPNLRNSAESQHAEVSLRSAMISASEQRHKWFNSCHRSPVFSYRHYRGSVVSVCLVERKHYFSVNAETKLAILFLSYYIYVHDVSAKYKFYQLDHNFHKIKKVICNPVILVTQKKSNMTDAGFEAAIFPARC